MMGSKGMKLLRAWNSNMSPCSTITPIRGAGHFPFCAPTRLSNPWYSTCNLVLSNHVFPPFASTFAAMLEDSTSLKSLSIQSVNSRFEVKAEEYVALIAALQYNRTLKTLRLRNHPTTTNQLTANKEKHVASLLKRNYALESLPNIDLENRAGDVGAILRLNAAGRRYLVQDGSSISKGVKVLSRVNNYINCVFLHLLENPRLCDRTAVEVREADENNSHFTSPTTIYSSGGEKREQVILHKGKESHRRLA
jgi:hypothetical protein